MELYKESDKYFVALQYNGKSLNICGEKDCEYQQFIDKLKSIIIDKEKEDLLNTYCLEQKQSKSSVMAFMLLINLIIIGVLSYLIYKQQKNNNETPEQEVLIE